MRAVLAVAILATGCLSANVGVGANAALAGPNRVADASFGVGTYVKVKNAVVIEPTFHFVLGPLGEKANDVPSFGARVLTHSHRWRPGYFGAVLAGSNETAAPREKQRVGTLYRVGGGVAWDAHSYLSGNDDHWWYDSFGVIAIGIYYTHEQQEGIGSGDFLGIELTVTGGFSITGLVAGIADEK